MPLLFCKSKKVSVKIDRTSYSPISYLHHYLFSIFHSELLPTTSHELTGCNSMFLILFYIFIFFYVFNPGACSVIPIDTGEFHVKVT